MEFNNALAQSFTSLYNNEFGGSKGGNIEPKQRSVERFGKAPPTGSGGPKGGNIEPTFQNFGRLERNSQGFLH